MCTAKTSASAEMFDHSSVQPPKRCSSRCAVTRALCSIERLPVREQSRIAPGPYVSRTRRIWRATSSSASSHPIRSNSPAARARHRERHRPSGFGFALADSIDYLDAATWDAVSTGQSLFLQRRYLGALERACPDNLAPRYALIFRGRQPVAGVVMQIVTVAGTRLMKPLAAAPGRGGLRSARALLSRT